MNKKRILVIEDEKALQNAITAKLSASDFDVVTARTAKEGLDIIESDEQIHAIWLDHYLIGDETGLDLVVKLKSDNRLKSIPIFVVSNTAGPDKVQSYIHLGVDKFYTKSDHRLDQIISDIRMVAEE